MMIALILYDVILSFPAEHRYIWRRRFGIRTMLYLTIRYSSIIFATIEMLGDILIIRNAIVSIKLRHEV